MNAIASVLNTFIGACLAIFMVVFMVAVFVVGIGVAMCIALLGSLVYVVIGFYEWVDKKIDKLLGTNAKRL